MKHYYYEKGDGYFNLVYIHINCICPSPCILNSLFIKLTKCTFTINF
jgi:hypothetical protein